MYDSSREYALFLAAYHMLPDKFTLARYTKLVAQAHEVSAYLGGRYTQDMERSADVDSINRELLLKMKLPHFFPESQPLPDDDDEDEEE